MSNHFHLAFPIKNVKETRAFYVDTLGCKVTKSTDHWLNIDFFGHQLSLHHYPHMNPDPKTIVVEEVDVPLNHFGVILKKEEWDELAERITKAKIKFLIKPKIKHKKQICEQAIMFLKDPSGHGIEFKCYTDPREAFIQTC